MRDRDDRPIDESTSPPTGADVGPPSATLLAVLDRLGVGVTTLCDDTIVELSDRACEILGRARTEVVGARSSVLLGSGNGVVPRSSTALVGEISTAVHEVELPDGADGFRHALVARALGGDPAVAALLDVTETATLRQLVSTSNEILQRVPAAVIVWEDSGEFGRADLRLVSANRAAHEMLGLVDDDRGRPLRYLLPGVSIDDVDRVAELVDTDDIDQLGDLVGRARDGSERLWRRVVIGLSGRRVALAIEDVTEARRAELQRLSLLRRVVAIGDDERRRLAAAVHDDVIQDLLAAALIVDANLGSVAGGALDPAAAHLGAAVEALRRVLLDLGPDRLADTSLAAAIEDTARGLLGDAGIVWTIDVDPRVEPPQIVTTTALQILGELLRNVVRHADASQVDVRVVGDGDALVLSVDDDGVGVHVDAEPGHMGLRIVVDRAAALGGWFSIAARPAGSGCSAVVRLPFRDGPVSPHQGAAPPDRGDLAELAPSSPEIDALVEQVASASRAAEETARRRQREQDRFSRWLTLSLRLRRGSGAEGDAPGVVVEQVAEAVRGSCWMRYHDDHGVPRVAFATTDGIADVARPFHDWLSTAPAPLVDLCVAAVTSASMTVASGDALVSRARHGRPAGAVVGSASQGVVVVAPVDEGAGRVASIGLCIPVEEELEDFMLDAFVGWLVEFVAPLLQERRGV